MQRLSAIVLTAAVALTAATINVRAAEPLADRLFGGPVGAAKSYACFVRRYDPRHLARHPRQRVSAMKLLVAAERDPESKALVYAFKLAVRFRDRTETFQSGGECGHAADAESGHLGCGVDCDGGGIGLVLAKDDKSIVMKTERVRIWRDEAEDDEGQDLPQLGGADDRAFKLGRASLDTCKTLMKDHDEVAADSRE
jgi:hypothetical protein